MYGVAAAVVVFVVIGGIAWLSRTDAGLQPVDQPAVTTEAPREPAIPVGAIDWTPIENALPGGFSDPIISDGNTLYTLVDAQSGSELWASADGMRWRLIAQVPFSDIEAAWEGKVLGVEPGQSYVNTAITVAVVDGDGAITESTLTPTVPAQHAPYARDSKLPADSSGTTASS